jgi:hypothetical protein
MPSRKRFVVIVERGSSEVPVLLVDDVETPLRFGTREEARAAAVGTMWERAWVWWIVELTDGGECIYGLDVEPAPTLTTEKP